jgi:hypothetical protein
VRFLNVEETNAEHPTHITIKPPTNDNRKRAVEKFAFTRVFEEDAQQMELFKGSGLGSMIEGVLGSTDHGRDGLIATLGVTGSGKVFIGGDSSKSRIADQGPESHHLRDKNPTRPHSDGTRCPLPDYG